MGERSGRSEGRRTRGQEGGRVKGREGHPRIREADGRTGMREGGVARVQEDGVNARR